MKEYVDFLGGQPPYDILDVAERERLARQLEIEYVTAGTVIVAAGTDALNHLYVIRTGAVEIVDRGQVLDLLGPGDTFGEQAADRLIQLTTGRVLVAHAAWIETAFLDRAFRRRGRRLTSPIVDTAALARTTGHALTAAPREPSSESLAAQLGLPVHTPHHALGDALTTAQILIVLAARLHTCSPATAKSLVRHPAPSTRPRR